MPRIIIYVLLLLAALTLIPLGLIYRAQHTSSGETRIQVVHDMDDQSFFKTQSTNPFFADGMAMRHHPEGTVARGLLNDDDAYFTGAVGEEVFIERLPVVVTDDLLARGRDRFDVFCAPCHGASGDGNGLVHTRAAALAEGTWTPPTDLTGQTVVDRPAGHLYNTIANGIRTMPSYGAQIDPDDRWAIVAYTRALQLSRNATVDDVPESERALLGR
jgi:mono/diheme cytochrome c family protein